MTVLTHFIHSSHLGITIGYRFFPEDGEIHLAMSFAHKPGPGFTIQARSKIDQFSRPVGRAIVTARLNQVATCGTFEIGSRIKFPGLTDEAIRPFNTELRKRLHEEIDTIEQVECGSVNYRKQDPIHQFDNFDVWNRINDIFLEEVNSFGKVLV